MGVIRGIEHIGITVPAIEQAERFFQAAFGARTLYALIEKGGKSQHGEDMHHKNGLEPGTTIVAMRMMRLGEGANVELFEVDGGHGSTPHSPSRMGLHHFALYVDDLNAAAAQFRAAGGTMREGPIDLGGKERGRGNRAWFGLTPWGLQVEFIHLPSPLALDDPQHSGPRWMPQEA